MGMTAHAILGDLLRLRSELDTLILRLRPVLRDAEADLLAAIRAAAGDQAFAAGNLWATAERLRAAARATGQPLPALPDALDAVGIQSSIALGCWLSRQPAIERLGRDESGVLWLVRPDASV